MTNPWPHISVMLNECVEALAPRDGDVLVDCTLGMGGHTEALLAAAECTVLGVDRDDDALRIARDRLARFGDRFVPVKGSFGQLGTLLDGLGIDRVDGILADLGVSSLQLDTAGRGFSFRRAGPVDMRMDQRAAFSAADVVNEWDEDALTVCIREYGEERHARRVAKAIIRGRPWTDTLALASTIADAIPGAKKSKIHPATRTFQAIRMAVNDELGQLESLLRTAEARLAPGGRLAIISFHSLEDRMVKQFLAKASGRGTPRDAWGHPIEAPTFTSRNRAIKPADDDPNPRARSARLRTAVRL